MSRTAALALVIVLAASPAFAKPAPADPREVVAAETAFAADTLSLGIKGGFLKWSAPEAILFAPDPVKAHDLYGARPDKPGKPLVWWPVWAGISRAGDLGFTSGPSTYDGQPNAWYFTVWSRQADGGWKWIYDGGVDADLSGAPPQGATPVYFAPATGPSLYPEHAWSQVQAAEAALARKAHEDLAAAYAPVLIPETRMQGSPAAPATTPAAVRAELAARARAIDFAPLGGSASVAGDLAWTYGDARWAAKDGPARGHYVRVWRHDRAGWRLVFDQILTVPPPKL